MLDDTQRAQLAQINSQIEQGQAQDALSALETLQHQVEGPGAAAVFYARGQAQRALGQSADAEQSFMTAYSIVRFGRNADARRLLGQTAEQLGLKDEATTAYQAVLAELPEDGEAQAGLQRLQRDGL